MIAQNPQREHLLPNQRKLLRFVKQKEEVVKKAPKIFYLSFYTLVHTKISNLRVFFYLVRSQHCPNYTRPVSFIFLSTPAPPNTLNFNGAHRKRKTLVAPEINISLDQSEGSILSDDFLDTPDDLDINVDDIETPDETDSLEFLGNGNELEWEGKRLVLGGYFQGLGFGVVFSLIFKDF